VTLEELVGRLWVVEDADIEDAQEVAEVSAA
jgi:hypothetical protein